MAFKIIFTPESNSDISQAIDFYNEQQSGLGEYFYSSLSNKIGLISDTPEIFPRYKSRYRKSILLNFPYTIFYCIEPSSILIIGIIHQSRGPEFLKNRLH
jgi:plasmid stabilization system protein ParE